MIDKFSECYKIERLKLDKLMATKKHTIWPFIRSEWRQAKSEYEEACADTMRVWVKLHWSK